MMSKLLFSLPAFAVALSLHAATPSEVAPQIPADAKAVIHVNIAEALKLPIVVSEKIADKINGEMGKEVDFKIEDFSSVTSFSTHEANNGAILIGTKLTPEKFAEFAKKKVSDTAVTATEFSGLKGIKIIAPKPKNPGMIDAVGAPLYPVMGMVEEGTFYILQKKPGTLIVGTEKGINWAIRADKRMTATSPLFTAIPSKDANKMIVWAAGVPSDQMKKAKANPMIPVQMKDINMVGGGAFFADSTYTIQLKGEMTTDTAAMQTQSGVQMMLVMASMGMQDPNQQKLFQEFTKNFSIKANKNNVGLALKLTDSFIKTITEQSQAKPVKRSKTKIKIEEEIDVEEEI